MAIFIELTGENDIKSSINIDKIDIVEPRLHASTGVSLGIAGQESAIYFIETYGEVIAKIEQKQHEARYLTAFENAMQMKIMNNQ